jgi:hypothetical protein
MMEDTRTIEEIRQENAELKERLENAKLRAQAEALPPPEPTLENTIEGVRDLVSGPFTLLADGRIDCTFNHPKHGLLPYTADPAEHESLLCRAIHAVAAAALTAPPKP